MKIAPAVALSISLLSFSVEAYAVDAFADKQSTENILPTLAAHQADLGGSDTQEFSFFGWSVAASGSTVVVGAPGYADDQGDSVAGKAYVFVKPASGWVNMVQTAELSPSDNGAGAGVEFGLSVAIAGNTIFVSAPGVGEVYVFVEPAGGWQDMTETAIIKDEPVYAGDNFGYSLAVNSAGSTLAVTAPAASTTTALAGSTFVFLKPVGGWVSTSTPQAVLTASDAQAYDEMGISVAIDGATIAVGAPFKPEATDAGAAYVFVRPASGWKNMTQTAKLTASKSALNAQLGDSITISGGTIAVGAPGPNPYAGSAYVFVEPAGGWKNSTETARLGAGHQYADGFGAGVSATANMIAVGASLADVGAVQQGAAYVYLKPASGWKSTAKYNYEFSDQYGIVDDALGYSVVLDGPYLIAGAPFAYALAAQGFAYVFTIP
jgi:hypothetical protein